MQSLMGDRLLKWFLNNRRRRFRRSGSARAESKPGSGATRSSLPEASSADQVQANIKAQCHAESTEGLVKSQSNQGLQSPSGETAADGEIGRDHERPLDEATEGRDDSEGCEP